MAPPASAPGQKAVLRGSKLPTWACSKCDRTANWACRVVCLCGAKAPPAVAKRARDAHERAEAQGGKGARGGGGGGGSEGKELQASIAKMVKEVLAKEVGALQQPRAPPGSGSQPPQAVDADDDPLHAQIEALESTVAGLKRAKLTGQLLVDAEAQLATLRAQRLEAKTPQNQVISLNGKLTRLRGKLERLEKAKSAKQQAVDDARAQLEQCLADQSAHDKDTQSTKEAIEAAEREVQAAVLRVAPAAGAAPGAGGAGSAPCPQLGAEEQQKLVEELLANDPIGKSVGEGASKILVTLLGKAMAKAAPPPAPAPGPPAGGNGAAPPDDDEAMPEAFDQSTADIIARAAAQPDAKRALAVAMQELNMVKRPKRS